MKKIRVVQCLGQLNTGGAETLTVNVLREMDRSTVQFDFLLFNDNPGVFDKEVIELGCNLYYTSSLGNVGLVKYIKEMINFFENKKPDVVHSHMDWQGGFIAYAAHKAGIKKIVVHSHANQKVFERNLIYKYMIQLNRYLIKKYATDVCACSKEAGQSLFEDRKFEVINNGIDMKRYLSPDLSQGEKLKKEFCIGKTDIVLGHVGSFSENKNQQFLIELFEVLVKKNSNYKLLLVGAGALKEKLENRVKELGLENQIIFTGVRLDVPEILKLVDIFLFPSIYEGLGIVAVEAQASKCQCILSDTIPKEVDMGIGLVEYVSLKEKDKWIESIERKSKEITEIEDNKIIDSKFNIGTTIEQLVKIYD